MSSRSLETETCSDGRQLRTGHARRVRRESARTLAAENEPSIRSIGIGYEGSE
jgi:hypothetical protein